MGKRGPAPTPTEVLKKRGSWRAKKRKGEPKPAEGAPVCPDWLMPEAKEAWMRLCGHLRGMKMLRACDEKALARYCQLWARWVRTEKRIAEHPEHERRDQRQKHAVALSDRLLKLEKEFGLTPAARAGMTTGKGESDTGKVKYYGEGA